MTTIYYGFNPHSGGIDSVATGTSTTGKALEVVIDNTKYLTENEVKFALDKIKEYIQQNRLNLS